MPRPVRFLDTSAKPCECYVFPKPATLYRIKPRIFSPSPPPKLAGAFLTQGDSKSSTGYSRLPGLDDRRCAAPPGCQCRLGLMGGPGHRLRHPCRDRPSFITQILYLANAHCSQCNYNQSVQQHDSSHGGNAKRTFMNVCTGNIL